MIPSSQHRPSEAPRRIAVIGGGITGLAAAHRIIELDPTAEPVVFEASDRLGGVLRTEHTEGFLLEASADNFITTAPWALDLCRRIGFERELISTNPAHRRAFIAHGTTMAPVPEGFYLMAPRRIAPLLRSPLLSLRGKLRLACEPFIPRSKSTEDESLASFARRRLGREAFERLVQPLVSGIYSADAEKLSVRAALPRFVEMERRHGGLLRAARREAAEASAKPADSGARYSLFAAPRDGMSSLIDALAARLPAGSVRLGAAVERVAPTDAGRWRVQLASGMAEPCDAVIAAAPAPRVAGLIADVDRELADELRGIPYAGATLVLAAYRREEIGHRLDGFGVVVPAVENRRMLAASFSSVKFAGRAPKGWVLVRVFFGGAMQPEWVDAPEEELRRVVREELGTLIDARAEPKLLGVHRWPAAMPQYHVGHLARIERIERRAAAIPRFALAGNAYHGVGIPHCVHSGEQAAERLLGKARES